MPPVMISSSGRVPGRYSEPSRSRVGDGGGHGTFLKNMIGYRVFSGGGQFIGERATRGDLGAAQVGPRRGQGWTAPGAHLGDSETPSSCPFVYKFSSSRKPSVPDHIFQKINPRRRHRAHTGNAGALQPGRENPKPPSLSSRTYSLPPPSSTLTRGVLKLFLTPCRRGESSPEGSTSPCPPPE